MRDKLHRTEVDRRQNGQTLLEVLSQELDLSKKKSKKLLDNRSVFVNQRRIWMAHHKVSTGDIIEVQQNNLANNKQAATVLWQDNDYLIANKPAGTLSNGPDSVESLLRQTPALSSLSAVHRMDRDTSGCLLFAKNQKAFEQIIPLFKAHEIRKIYKTIAEGCIEKKELTIDQQLEGKTAVTRIIVLKAGKQASYLKINLVTGRTHQIRKHLAAIRHPVAGDKKYGSKRNSNMELRTIPRQMLHAEQIAFISPFTGQEIQCKASLPKDFKRSLHKLGL